MGKISLKEILTKYGTFSPEDEMKILLAMKETAVKTLDNAAENAKIKDRLNYDDSDYTITKEVDKKTILNTIKNIEMS